MKAQINNQGTLMLKRKGVFVIQICPFSQDNGYCGAWCPLFLEADDCEEEVGFKQIVALGCGYGSPIHEIVKDEREEVLDGE